MVGEPHLRRVGMQVNPQADFRLSTTTASTSSSTSDSIIPYTPPIPPRSPLRPPAAAAATRKPSVQSALASLDSASAPPPSLTITSTTIQDRMPLSLLHSRSFGTMTGLLDNTRTLRPKTPEKPLPHPPDSVISLVSLDDDDDLDLSSSASARSSLMHTPAVTQSKRTYALLELLSSERAYASDLALIRDIHIPLALGNHATPFGSHIHD